MFVPVIICTNSQVYIQTYKSTQEPTSPHANLQKLLCACPNQHMSSQVYIRIHKSTFKLTSSHTNSKVHMRTHKNYEFQISNLVCVCLSRSTLNSQVYIRTQKSTDKWAYKSIHMGTHNYKSNYKFCSLQTKIIASFSIGWCCEGCCWATCCVSGAVQVVVLGLTPDGLERCSSSPAHTADLISIAPIHRNDPNYSQQTNSEINGGLERRPLRPSPGPRCVHCAQANLVFDYLTLHSLL